jgi:hypothetical protein
VGSVNAHAFGVYQTFWADTFSIVFIVQQKAAIHFMVYSLVCGVIANSIASS